MAHFKDNSLIKIHLPLFLVQVCFATLPIFSKIAFKAFEPGVLVFVRVWGAAFSFGLAYFIFGREKLKDKKHLLHFAVLALFGVVANINFYLQGLRLTTAINATVILSAIPILTLIFAIALKKEAFTPAKIAGVIIAFIGVCLIIDLKNFNLGGYFKGNLFVLINSASYALYLVFVKPYFEIYKPFTIITYVFLFASIEIIPFVYKDIAAINFHAIPPDSYFPLLMVLVLGTICPYLFNTLALKHAPSSFVAVYVYLQQVLAIILAIVVLGEAMTFRIIIAAFLIVLGIIIVRFKSKILLSSEQEIL